VGYALADCNFFSRVDLPQKCKPSNSKLIKIIEQVFIENTNLVCCSYSQYFLFNIIIILNLFYS